ncbi:uncharacterized protein L201_001890 [Kwoniella dendrophila CBS 6074]|uniref:INO80 complex subunit B-like conserved region domain-containing protein n=1 Tax=Kwoniella dendrophila CBS 6074 TaxID=1295534 RepID=A0AAX4JQ63_9TREE
MTSKITTNAIPSSTRRAKRIIQSPSGSSSEASVTPKPPSTTSENVPKSDRSLRIRNNNGKRPIPPDDSDVESEEGEDEDDLEGEGEEVDQEDEEDGEGEDELQDDVDDNGDVDMDRTRLSSAIASEDIPLDQEEEEEGEEEDAEGEAEEEEDELDDNNEESPSKINTNTPSSALKIKLNVSAKPSSSSNTGGSGRRPGRPAAKNSAKKIKKVAEDEFADSDDELMLGDGDGNESVLSSSRRSLSPTKMTARQRAKGNKDLQETLIQLPNEVSGKKLILTEAERLQKREETARRRKRQTEQKLQDEQDETINRLLRAQTSKSRSKLDQPSPAIGEDGETSGQVSPSRRVPVQPSNMIRWSSTLNKDGNVLIRVAAPKGKDDWIALTPSPQR